VRGVQGNAGDTYGGAASHERAPRAQSAPRRSEEKGWGAGVLVEVPLRPAMAAGNVSRRKAVLAAAGRARAATGSYGSPPAAVLKWSTSNRHGAAHEFRCAAAMRDSLAASGRNRCSEAAQGHIRKAL